MKRDVTKVFTTCKRCGGEVWMDHKQFRKWQDAGKPPVECESCRGRPKQESEEGAR